MQKQQIVIYFSTTGHLRIKADTAKRLMKFLKIVSIMPKNLFAKPQDYTYKGLMDSQTFSLFNGCK